MSVMPHRDPEQYRAYQRAYRENNKERLAAQKSEWQKKNRVRVRKNVNAWRKENPERRRAERQVYYEKHREQILARNRQKWAALSSAEREAIGRRKYWKHRERRLAASKRDYEANRHLYRDRYQAYRARLAGAQVEVVKRLTVFERDSYVCQICGKPTEGQHPELLSPALDHIIPISKGGEHSYANVQTAHFSCNSKKSNKLAA